MNNLPHNTSEQQVRRRGPARALERRRGGRRLAAGAAPRRAAAARPAAGGAASRLRRRARRGALRGVAAAGPRAGPGPNRRRPQHAPLDPERPQVEALFAPYGEVVSLRLVRASRMGASTKTFAFVKYATVQVRRRMVMFMS